MAVVYSPTYRMLEHKMKGEDHKVHFRHIESEMPLNSQRKTLGRQVDIHFGAGDRNLCQ